MQKTPNNPIQVKFSSRFLKATETRKEVPLDKI